MRLREFAEKHKENDGMATLVNDPSGRPRVRTNGVAVVSGQYSVNISDVDMPYFLACWLRCEHNRMPLAHALELIHLAYRPGVAQQFEDDLDIHWK